MHFCSAPEKRTGGWFELDQPKGQMHIGDEQPTPVNGRYLAIRFVRGTEFELSDGSIIAGGFAEGISSSTTDQMLPSLWDNLPTWLQMIASAGALGLLTWAFRQLFKG